MRVPSAALRSLRNVAAGASAVMTLMACYGAAYYEGPVAPADPCEGYDQDVDGVCSDVDCDDTNAQVGACPETMGGEGGAIEGEVEDDAGASGDESM